MSRVLLVDDEPLVTSTLQTLILDAMPDMEVCCVHSASEALDLLGRNVYDVVVTDVSMPRISGLELLEHIKKQGIVCYVIVLTAYNSFDYAYKASQYEDVRFILKIEPPDVIMDAIRTGLDRIRLYYSANTNDKRILQYTKETLPLLRQALLERLLVFGDELPEPSVRESCGIHIVPGKETWLAVTGNIGAQDKKQEICCLVLSTLQGRGLLTDVWYTDSNLVFLMQAGEDGPCMPASVRGQLDRVIEGAGADVGLSFALSSSPVPWPRLSEGLSRLLRYARQDLESSRILPLEPLTMEKRAVTLGDALRWRRHIEKRELSGLIAALRDCVLREGFPQGRQGCAVLLQMLLRESFGGDCLEGLKVDGYTAEAILHHSPFASADDWLSQVRALLETLFCGLGRQVSGTDETLDRINRYIQEHFSGQISLTQIADHFSYNSSYLSRIYKLNMHEGINEHITRIRIEAACRLLQSSALSISDIAAQCGFQTTKYFITAFKRVKGVTPKGWRDAALM